MFTSRRDFLNQVAAGATVWSSVSSRPGQLQAAEAGDESFWESVRRQFSFTEEKVPMNAANLCPSPAAVAQLVNELTADIDRDCSFQNREKFDRMLELSREKVARRLGISPDEVALVRNTTEANNIINNGVSLKPGDEIIIWDQNHPTNNVAWDVRAVRFNLVVRRVSTPDHPEDTGRLIEVFTKAFNPRTRLLAITHASNTSGLRLPVRELCEIARRFGIYVHVDGAQAWGALNVNLRELGCDSYTASSHKWLLGPKEAGLLYVRQDRVPEIWPNCVGSGWGSTKTPEVQGARRFESLGQRDDACLAAIATAVDFHQSIGPSQIESRILHLAAALKAGARELGARLLTPAEPELSAGVCVIKISPEKRQQVFDRFYTQFGIAGAPTGGMRLCPHIYNTAQHIERALEALKSVRELLR
ncbi:MAG: aminotransferase class V-fold PLP-dependent enzyme [Acidobacteriota bacterium]